MSHAQSTIQPDDTAGDAYFARSYAKINLTLDVLGKRADGYHDLATIMQTIDLYDTICLQTTEGNEVRILCSRPELSNEDNLAVRAVQAVRQRLSLTQGVAIELHKRIPVAAGLGGGSSNAATTLLALRHWWRLPLSSTDLLDIAASLGSDVPFFLTGGLALCEGRGERVTPLLPRWPSSMRWLLLLKPSIGVSTATVFRNLPTSDYGDGSHSQTIRSAFAAKSGLPLQDLYNSLERSVLERYPEVAQAREDMLQTGAYPVRLSGSGPTLFAMFSRLDAAVMVQHKLQEQGYELYLTRAVCSNEENITFF